MQPLEWFSLQKWSGWPLASATNLPAAKHWRYASAASRAYSSPPALRKSAINSASNCSQRFLSDSYWRSPAPSRAAVQANLFVLEATFEGGGKSNSDEVHPLLVQNGRRFSFMYWMEYPSTYASINRMETGFSSTSPTSKANAAARSLACLDCGGEVCPIQSPPPSALKLACNAFLVLK